MRDGRAGVRGARESKVRAVRNVARVALVFVLVAVVAVGGLLAWVFGRALPQTSGSLTVPGLTAKVSVLRDTAGITQIYAANPDDLFFAQGFVHASERMWQMEVWRRIGEGRLSELFGSDGLDKDLAIRTMGWRQAGVADYAAASPATKRALDQYAAGVNAWLAQNKGKLSFPFVVAAVNSGVGGLGGYDPEPWTGVDSTTFVKLQAWGLGANLDTEILKATVDAKLGRADITDLLTPGYQPDMPVIVNAANGTATSVPVGSTGGAAPVTTTAASPAPAADTASTSVGSDLAAFAATAASINALSGLGSASGGINHPGIGSNNWVVAPSKSATGTALLANDPHLGISMPSVWFMDGLHCETVSEACPFDVVGVSFPGTPGVVLGHNARIAWGFTNVNPDVQDLFVETPDPADPNRYLYKGQSLAYETRDETISIAGEAPRKLTVRTTVHGPVISDLYADLKSSGKVYALRWTALAETDGALDTFMALDVAGTFAQFRDAFRTFGAPSQNVVYADVDGNIGLQVPGRIPVRPAGAKGDRPVDGASGANDWTGYVPYDQLPSLYNPPTGIIVTANNEVVDATYPYFLGSSFDAGWRAKRIRELLDQAAANGGVTQAEFAKIQMDTKLERARGVSPTLLAATPATADGRAVQDLVRGWDETCGMDSRGCAAFEVTNFRLQRGLFEPWLGSQIGNYIGTDASNTALRVALANPASPLWDDPNTATVETRESRAAAALDGAGGDLRATLGDPARWAWGSLHRVTFKEITLGEAGRAYLDAFLNAGPFAVNGAADAVNNTIPTEGAWYADSADPSAKPGTLFDAFATDVMPSYRFTIDMGKPDAATIVQTTGQSGNPFDRHYGDLIDDWIAGRTVPLPFTRAAVDGATVSTLELRP
jgi:penicillin G amidase